MSNQALSDGAKQSNEDFRVAVFNGLLKLGEHDAVEAESLAVVGFTHYDGLWGVAVGMELCRLGYADEHRVDAYDSYFTPTDRGKIYAAALKDLIDHHTNQAKEDERRRIDELAEQLGVVSIVNVPQRGWAVRVHRGAFTPTETRMTLTAALEAATQKQGE